MKKPDAILKLTTGQKLYEQRARAALPILVRQALLQAPLTYGVLAKELQMPLARNLNYVLGIIGSALRQLGKAWGMQIPPLQCLVVNKRTGIPGRGIGWFITNKKHFQSLPLQQQRSLVHDKLREVCAFADWPRVLNAFGLKPAIDNFAAILNQAAQPKRGGESDEHKRLKEWVATHPALLKLPGSATSEQEALLPSGDAVDVLFRTPEEWIPVEVKSAISPAADILRGLFQCIKYQAVIEAYRPTIQQPKRARAILVLGGGFPKQYAQLRDLLGVDVREQIHPMVVKTSKAHQ